MSLDVGRQRTGVAVSDFTWTLARSLTVVEHRGRDRRLGEIARLAQENDVTRMVIGYPLNMDGSAGEQAAYVDSYVGRLADVLHERSPNVEIVRWDERLTTVEAESLLREAGAPRQGRRGLDAVAAAVILQEYLDSMQSASCGPARSGAGREETCETP